MGNNLEKVVLPCVCGNHNLTLREAMQGIAHPNSESEFITYGLSRAIMKFYGAPAELQRTGFTE